MKPALRKLAPPLDDAALLGAVAAGDASALGLAFDRWHHDVFALLVRVRATRWAVDDLVQETFLALPGAAANYTPGRSARAFVLGVAMQMCRRERRRFARRLNLWRTHGEGLDESLAHDDPERDAANREALGRVSVALARLPEAQRDAVVLVELEGLTGDEAAAIMGVPVNTVWTRLHYGRAALREALSPKERRP